MCSCLDSCAKCIPGQPPQHIQHGMTSQHRKLPRLQGSHHILNSKPPKIPHRRRPKAELTPSPIPPSSDRNTATEQNQYIPPTHPRPNLAQTLTNPQNSINQQPIRRSLDLKVAKECVRPEQTQHLVQRIVALGVGFGGEVCGQRGVEWEGVGWTADAGAQWEEGKVSDVGGCWG